jgi:hypothetical protein
MVIELLVESVRTETEAVNIQPGRETERSSRTLKAPSEPRVTETPFSRAGSAKVALAPVGISRVSTPSRTVESLMIPVGATVNVAAVIVNELPEFEMPTARML